MTPTDALRVQLRAYVNERIPEGGTAADTRFADADLDRILEDSSSIEEAACKAWREKAVLVFEENKGVVEKRVGSEVLKLITPADKRDHALEMADYFCSLAPVPAGSGSRLLGFEPPDEISRLFRDSNYEPDHSRLIGHTELE